MSEDTKKILSNIKVFVVEDDKFMVDILYHKLSESGATVSSVNDGESALDGIRSFQPDVVLLDILLPGIDGFEVLKQIRSDEKMKMLPVVILSNLSAPADISKGEKLGANRFYVKSLQPLDKVIENIVIVVKPK